MGIRSQGTAKRLKPQSKSAIGWRLPATFRAAIASTDNRILVSAASIWETAIKSATGKLSFSGSAAKALDQHGFQPLSITVEHAEWADQLPLHHRDPFDRVLVAQAQLEGLTLVSVDDQILHYQVPHL
ncbi:MAG TPA: type II toxin-antitoxin system VapC family toxin [Terriglobia bacterium]|nr:type II toxin-antitoxin system VapC family toxin [Terriglobia bacterium]